MDNSNRLNENSQPVPGNEDQRIKALSRYESPDGEPEREEAFDRLAKLAAQICETPIAFINLIGIDKEFKKACYGFEGDTTCRSISFCQHTIMQDDVFEVPDATEDPLFQDNPNVTGSLNLRFYAGIPLKTPDDFNIGTLCLVDHEPKTLTDSQKEALKILADEIVSRFELNALKKKMESRHAEKDELIRIVSHDMRNPLMGVIGFSELLKQETANEEHREMLDYIESAGESMLNIVNVLLNSEYIRNEAFIISRKKADAADLTRKVIDLHRPFALLKKLDMNITVPDEIHCSLDAEKWKQIVGNLLSNAIKFSHTNGRIDLTLTSYTTRRTFLNLKITDKGVGMPEKMVKDIFSGKDSINREGTEGETSTGLGMYIVKKYVSLMKGTIHITSQPGEGTNVEVKIPA